MAIPRSMVPRNNSGIYPKALRTIPTVNKSNAPDNVFSIPNRLVKSGVNVDKIPNATNGSVVSKPNIELDKPVASRIIAINGPTPDNAGLRLKPISIIPAINKI